MKRQTLFQLIETHGLTQVARMIKVDPSQLSKVNKGRLGLSERIIRGARRIWGKGFDLEGSFDHLMRIRAEHQRSASSDPSEAQGDAAA